MYDLINHGRSLARRVLAVATITACCGAALGQNLSADGSVVRKIIGLNEKLEITTNTSKILTLDKRIPKVQVNNPELLAITPLSANEVQVAALKAGVTQVNLWDEDGEIHTVEVYIYGDVRELEYALKTQFPNSSIRVYRYSQSLVLTGFIDRPDYVDPIRQLAEDYAPKVINNISVGGVQQVLLKVKLFEVSRTKLRQLGVDIATIGSGGYFGTSVSGLLANVGSGGNPLGVTTIAEGVKGLTDTAGQTVEFAITDGSDAFVGLINALQQKNAAKILAEPNIVAVSGRPATFNEGGEIPILIPQGLGQVSIEYKPYGTQVDFLPIVLGNGKIRLEVRPRVSEIDASRSITIDDTNVPALTVRQVDTAVEMYAGQTFAIAGLIQQRNETVQRGLPLLADIPVLGVPFRTTSDQVNEIELLVLVTPELVDAMDPHEVPPCGPGMATISPGDRDLYCAGKMEVPDRCSPCGESNCPPCVSGGYPTPAKQFIGGYGGPAQMVPMQAEPIPAGTPNGPSLPEPGETARKAAPLPKALPKPSTLGPKLSAEQRPAAATAPASQPKPQAGSPHFVAQAPTQYVRRAAIPAQPAGVGDYKADDSTGLIGPVGYDAE